MYCSEEEAKKKWCPMARHLYVHDPEPGTGMMAAAGVNRSDDGLVGTCVASRCMLWRWSRPEKGKGNGCCGLGYKMEL